jgi:hypothetical protein
MGSRIMKQPNGKFCRWSSIVDSFTHYNYTREELLADLEAQMLKEWRRDMNATFDRANESGDGSRYLKSSVREKLIGSVFPHGPEAVLARAKAMGIEIEGDPKFQSLCKDYAESRRGP